MASSLKVYYILYKQLINNIILIFFSLSVELDGFGKGKLCDAPRNFSMATLFPETTEGLNYCRSLRSSLILPDARQVDSHSFDKLHHEELPCSD